MFPVASSVCAGNPPLCFGQKQVVVNRELIVVHENTPLWFTTNHSKIKKGIPVPKTQPKREKGGCVVLAKRKHEV